MVLSGSQQTQLLCYYRCYSLLTIKLHVSASSDHHQVLSIQKRLKMVLYNLCNGVSMKRSCHQYSVLWILL